MSSETVGDGADGSAVGTAVSSGEGAGCGAGETQGTRAPSCGAPGGVRVPEQAASAPNSASWAIDRKPLTNRCWRRTQGTVRADTRFVTSRGELGLHRNAVFVGRGDYATRATVVSNQVVGFVRGAREATEAEGRYWRRERVFPAEGPGDRQWPVPVDPTPVQKEGVCYRKQGRVLRIALLLEAVERVPRGHPDLAVRSNGRRRVGELTFTDPGLPLALSVRSPGTNPLARVELDSRREPCLWVIQFWPG